MRAGPRAVTLPSAGIRVPSLSFFLGNSQSKLTWFTRGSAVHGVHCSPWRHGSKGEAYHATFCTEVSDARSVGHDAVRPAARGRSGAVSVDDTLLIQRL